MSFLPFCYLLSSMQDLIQRHKRTCGASQVEGGEASQPQVSLGFLYCIQSTWFRCTRLQRLAWNEMIVYIASIATYMQIPKDIQWWLALWIRQIQKMKTSREHNNKIASHLFKCNRDMKKCDAPSKNFHDTTNLKIAPTLDKFSRIPPLILLTTVNPQVHWNYHISEIALEHKTNWTIPSVVVF